MNEQDSIELNEPTVHGHKDVIPRGEVTKIVEGAVVTINGTMFRVRKKTDKDVVLRPLTPWQASQVKSALASNREESKTERIEDGSVNKDSSG